MNRHDHSVVETAAIVAGLATGSYGELQREKETELVAWLEWRITDGWNSCALGEAGAYDRAVHQLASAALELFRIRRKR